MSYETENCKFQQNARALNTHQKTYVEEKTLYCQLSQGEGVF